MENKKIQLIKKLADKYGIAFASEESELAKIKKQLKKLSYENFQLKEEIAELEGYEEAEFFLIRFWRSVKDSLSKIFKREKHPLKDAQAHFSNAYKELAELVNYGFWSFDDMYTFINNEGNISYRMQSIQKRLDDKRKKEVYDSIIKRDIPLQKELLEKAKAELLVLREHLLRLEKIENYESESINSESYNEYEAAKSFELKNNAIAKIQKRIVETENIINQLQEIEEERKKEEAKVIKEKHAGKVKRKVGRPKGTTNVKN